MKLKAHPTVKSTQTYQFPDDLYYDDANHMWAKQDEATNRIIVGIDALGLEALGEIAYISLLAVGLSVQHGDSIGVLEAAKMTGDVVAPVSGTLVARNEPVMRDPSVVNEDPYDKGWLVVIEPNDWETESAKLIQRSQIPAWVEAEIERYRSQGWID
ncbi:MAG: glycine cleavage system protein H [Chloroflexi bacterium]|nr:glycine cleavage system protein H [Chloroflexota bacterium]